MKIKTLVYDEPNRLRALVGMVLVGVSFFIALSAYAAVEPTVSVVVKNGLNATTTTAVIGTPVRAEVSVTSSSATTTPQGTVTFSLYANTTCVGTATEQAGVSLVDGMAVSGTTTLGVTGLSYRVHFNGETDVYTPADSSCVAVSATQFTPTISLGISSSTVPVGTAVIASASLIGASSTATGFVTYSVYTSHICSVEVATAGTKTVINGIVSPSDAVLFNTPGTFYWSGVYSGDIYNASATSSCGNMLTVLATSSPSTTTPPLGFNSIGGVVYNDQNKNDVRDGGEPGLSGWTIKLHKAIQKKNGKWTYNDKQVVGTTTTNVNGLYSFTNLPSGTYIVEQVIMKGWKQTSDDPKVILSTTTSSVTVNFSNIVKKAHGKDKGKDKEDKKEHGNHWGWFKQSTKGDQGFWKQVSSR